MSKVACAASLLTSVALAVLWARSSSHMDGVIYADPSGRGNWSHCLHTRDGAVHYLYTGPPQSAAPGLRVLAGPQSPPLAAMVDRPHWRVLGFAGGGVNTFWFVSVPFWFPILTTAALPGAWLVRRARRRSLGNSPVCPKCLRPHGQCHRRVPGVRQWPRGHVGTMAGTTYRLALSAGTLR